MENQLIFNLGLQYDTLGLEVLYLQHKAPNLDHIVYSINVGQMCDLTPVAFFFFFLIIVFV